MNTWPRDPQLSQVGRFIQLTMDNDIEGKLTDSSLLFGVPRVPLIS